MKRITGRLYTRGNKGTFYLAWQHRGQRFTRCTGTAVRRDAEQEAARILAPFQAATEAETAAALVARLESAQETAADLGPGLTIRNAWSAYLDSEDRPRSGPATLAQYESHWNAWAAWMAEHHPDTTHLRDVTADHAQAFVRHLTGRGLSGGRVNKHTTFLRAAFRVLGPAGRVKENPFAKIAARDHETESRRAFTIDQLRIIIERATGSLQTLLMLGTFTGLRFGDCCTLRWDEVNLTTRIITRHPNKTRRRKHEPVVLGVPEVLARHLEALPRKGPFVVPDHARAYPAQAPILSRRIQAHLTACGITTTAPGTGGETGKRAVTWYGFHSLRHTYVSMHAAAGTPQAVMMKLAGHGSPAMSQHYTHLSAETARQTAAALPAILGPASPEARAPLPGWAVEAVKRCRTIKEVRAALGVE